MGFWDWSGWDAVSALGTVAAFGAVAVDLLLQGRTSRREQASQVFLHPKEGPRSATWVAEINNASTKPINHVTFVSRPTLPGPPRSYQDTQRADVDMIIPPGEKRSIGISHRPGFGDSPHGEGRVYVEFRDMAGRQWHVDQFGNLRPHRFHEHLRVLRRRVYTRLWLWRMRWQAWRVNRGQ